MAFRRAYRLTAFATEPSRENPRGKQSSPADKHPYRSVHYLVQRWGWARSVRITAPISCFSETKISAKRTPVVAPSRRRVTFVQNSCDVRETVTALIVFSCPVAERVRRCSVADGMRDGYRYFFGSSCVSGGYSKGSSCVSGGYSKGSSCVSGGYSKMHERRGIIPSLEPGFGGWFLTN